MKERATVILFSIAIVAMVFVFVAMFGEETERNMKIMPISLAVACTCSMLGVKLHQRK